MKFPKFFSIAFLFFFALINLTNAYGQEQVKLGYLHTPAVDSQLWIGVHKGYFKEEGLNLKLVAFSSGIPLMEALASGKVDVAIMGAVISNYPAQGIGKVFLLNSIEYDTAMLFARPETKAQVVQDVRNKTIFTTKGTTAHVFLHTALKANGIDSTKDVRIVNSDMAKAVDDFIAGKNPFVCTWSPFHVYIWDKVPDAVMLSSAKDNYPDAAIIGGWVAGSKYYKNHKETLKKLIRVWTKANDYLVTQSTDAIKLIHDKSYADVPFEDIQASWDASVYLTSKKWVSLYANGKAANWLGQVQKVFVEIGELKEVVDPETFFDSSLFLSVNQ